ncbi:MAG: D-alanyl-D-alanine carboxypeptidase [Clostridia bacterium]|nr:D-alanyl-D-alanine carboxypeptidase [Clostridia bacterium]MBR3324592.1 D-alanyl-D-alanine carboxypeptidase [Clostridia bacterium]
MRSGNDAAVALATHIGGSIEEFANLMNNKAKEIGLTNTNYVTPHGLDNPNHYTTALELAKLTDYSLKNEIFATIVKTKYATIMINGETKEIKNTNEILCANYDGVYGVKTGFTNNAGRCLVTAIKRNNIDLIIVVLGADTKKDRGNDTIKLIDYAYKNYRIENIEEKVKVEFENWKNINQDRIYIHKGSSKINTIIGEIPIKEIVSNSDITVDINSITYLEAPIEKNEQVGIINVKRDNETIEQIKILIEKEIKKMNMLDYCKLFAKTICM